MEQEAASLFSHCNFLQQQTIGAPSGVRCVCFSLRFFFFSLFLWGKSVRCIPAPAPNFFQFLFMFRQRDLLLNLLTLCSHVLGRPCESQRLEIAPGHVTAGAGSWCSLQRLGCDSGARSPW